MASDTLTVIDNRTGKKYEVPISNGAIKATDLYQIKVTEDDGLVSYDPGFMNTASCQSKITYIDGDKGVLLYRGYPIEQLADKSDYLECCYLLLNGELPVPIGGVRQISGDVVGIGEFDLLSVLEVKFVRELAGRIVAIFEQIPATVRGSS